MKRINQLGSNKLKKGNLYDFEVVSNNLEKENLISLKLNEEYYTVNFLKNQKKKDLPKVLKCEVKSIQNGEVVLVQKKKRTIFLLLLALLGLLCVVSIAFFYQKDLKGFEEDVDNESEIIEVKKPVIKEEKIEFKVNGFGATTNVKDMSKDEYQAFLQNKNKDGLASSSLSSPSSTPAVYFSLNDFKESIAKKGEVNISGFKFNKKEALLTESHKTYIKEVVETCNRINKKGVFNISGFTCDLGTDQFNMALSKARAIAVKEFLETLDLNENEVEVYYYGESKFKAMGDLEESRALNRLAIISYVVEE
ncbi:OmpA family protein [Polaribacter sp. 20A6]|uniref:OmpA family protein n=1 Tax=Polaribacter sp. 20A6 TaxID=2687289 RepID=UPI0013FD7B6E|nr:OmpA family protein [Polaribacter sp. 20A6]